MKKKNYFLLSAISPFLAFSQIGINTDSPLTTLHIGTRVINTPSNNEGLIIPRVLNLNTQTSKPNGLLVFLDSNNSRERGFWYWSNTQWYPFFSNNMLSQDRSASVYEGEIGFLEGNYTLAANDSDIRTINFKNDNLPLNNDNHSYVNNNGKIVITKSGNYDITAVVTLNVIADNKKRRDSYEFIVRRSGSDTSVISAYGFPNSGTTYNLTNSISLNGALALNVGDEIDIKVNRYNKGSETTGNVTGATNNMLTNIVSNLTNLTLRYIGQ